MKDIVSILQSRIAKRENELANLWKFFTPYDRGAWYSKALQDHAKKQKEDKKILAEIIKLRRVVKIVKRQEAIMRALDSVYDPVICKLPTDFVELIHLGEK